MEQFSLEKYLANPSRKVVTGEGRNARIICTDRRDLGRQFEHPIVALVESICKEKEIAACYTKDGMYADENTSRYDLFFAPEKHEGWINIYEDMGNRKYTGIYDTKAEAEDSVSPEGCYLTTIKIEWEE